MLGRNSHALAARLTGAKRPIDARTGTIGLVLVSLVFSLVLCEGLARELSPAPLPWRYPQLRYRPDADLIFALAPDQRAFTADKPVAINSRGLRGRQFPYERTPGRLRILFLGDSIVFGYGVNDADVVTSRLEAHLRALGVQPEVIDAGVPAYNTDQEITYLDREGLRYRPDWVIVGFCWNDVSDKTGVLVSPGGSLATAGDESSRDENESDHSATYAVRNALKNSRLLYVGFEGWRGLMSAIFSEDHTRFRDDVLEGRQSAAVTEGWDRVASALQRLRTLSDTHGFRTLVVAFPIPVALDRDFPHSSYPSRLQEVATGLDLPFLDLGPAFRAAYRGHDSLFIPYDGDHPNAAGHEIAAREVTQFLTSRNVSQITER